MTFEGSVDDLIHALASVGYQAERRLATAVFFELAFATSFVARGRTGRG